MNISLKSLFITCLLVLFSGLSLNAQEIDKSSESEVLEVAEQMPRFPGCETKFSDEEQVACSQRKMLEYVFTNVEYPTEARKKDITGVVVAEFIIGKDGKMRNLRILREVAGGCSEEVLRVLGKMTSDVVWIPAKNKGESVDLKYTIPVKFEL